MKNRIGYKRFTFRPVHHATRTAIEVTIVTDKDFKRRTQEVTAATYDRFANLANSGDYNFSVLPSFEGMAWEICRLAR